jgi:hypothetical protein
MQEQPQCCVFERSSVSVHEFCFFVELGQRYVSDFFWRDPTGWRACFRGEKEPRNAAEHLVSGRGCTCAGYGVARSRYGLL